MKYRIEMDSRGKKEKIEGDSGLDEILEAGDRMIEKAIKESE